MPAQISDKLTQTTVNSRPVPTTVTSTRAGAGTTLSCLALTGWPTATAVHFITYKINTSNQKVAGSQIDWKGIVSGTTLTGLTLMAGTDSGNAVGDIVEAAPTAAYANDLYTWGSAHANQDGSLISSVVRTALGQTSTTGAGWTTLGNNPNTTTANGNRSYTQVFNAVDLTPTLSVGMRLLEQRTVAAPNQCTNLNGTTQFFNSTSPNKMTFTNNFVVSAWVKLTSYGSAIIAGRRDANNGWDLALTPVGTVRIEGFNGGLANTYRVDSYQSIPLNKWVYIAAQLDMSGTVTTGNTNSYIMLDGVEVPSAGTRAGTSPTSLLQGTGDLNIGAAASSSFFPGKIAQMAIYNAKVTEAAILASMNQPLVGTETSLASAYSLSNSLLDLNTTTPNNLTANGSATTTTTDSPYAQGATAGTLEYGVIDDIVFSTNTTITVRIAEGSQLPTTGGISAVSYSSTANPYGFPTSANSKILQQILLSATFTSTATVPTLINGMTMTYTVPTGGKRLKISAHFPQVSVSGNQTVLYLLDGATQLQGDVNNNVAAATSINFVPPSIWFAAGIHTFTLFQVLTGAGTATYTMAATNQASFTLEEA